MESTNRASRKHNIFIVDGYPVVCEGLSRIINAENDLAVCGDATDTTEAVKLIKELEPRLVVTDIVLDGRNGFEFIKSLRKQFPKLSVLVFSTCHESLHAERALRSGANGYLMKQEDRKTLVSAIRQVLEGKTYVSPQLNEQLLHQMSAHQANGTPADIIHLSDRELEVFQLIGKGYGTRQIADELMMAMKTVETHRQHIKRKLRMKNTFELVQRAIHWIHLENGIH